MNYVMCEYLDLLTKLDIIVLLCVLCQIYVIDSADRKRFEETGVVSLVLLRNVFMGHNRRRKTLISNRGRWSSLSLFRQIRLGEGKL